MTRESYCRLRITWQLQLKLERDVIMGDKFVTCAARVSVVAFGLAISDKLVDEILVSWQH